MNFTKLYYPTAESADADPEFIKKILSDDNITVDLAILPLSESANIVVTFLNQILFSGWITEELLLNLTVTPSDWLWKNGELSIQLLNSNSHSEIKLTRCKLQQINMLTYPLSELIFIKCNNKQWIDTSIQTAGELSITVTNPICTWATYHAPGYNLVSAQKLVSTVEYTSAETDNKQIAMYLKKLRV